jgi:hypothetical protein
MGRPRPFDKIELPPHGIRSKLIRAHGGEGRLHLVQFGLVSDAETITQNPENRIYVWVFRIEGIFGHERAGLAIVRRENEIRL